MEDSSLPPQLWQLLKEHDFSLILWAETHNRFFGQMLKHFQLHIQFE